MEMEFNETLNGAYDAVLNFVREHQAEGIDEAYEFFWEEEYPEDFLSGIALDIAFVNFEDWLVCDYKYPDTFIDAFSAWKNEKGEDVNGETQKIFEAMKSSYIGLYEVASSNDGLTLKDVLFGGEIKISGDLGGLGSGDLFAARVIKINDANILGRCVYPFKQNMRDTVLGYVEKQFSRYKKHKPDGSMKGFLKEEAYLFNVIWINSLMKVR